MANGGSSKELRIIAPRDVASHPWSIEELYERVMGSAE